MSDDKKDDTKKDPLDGLILNLKEIDGTPAKNPEKIIERLEKKIKEMTKSPFEKGQTGFEYYITGLSGTSVVIRKEKPFTEIERGVLHELEKEIKKPAEQGRLFNNQIDTEQAFGISREFTDNLKKLIEEITPETAGESFKYNAKTFKDKTGELALRVIDNKQEIQTAEQFFNALEKIKSGKVLQTLLALWAYGNKQGSFFFNGTRISKIMQTILKTKTYFTQPQKRDFTEAIQKLRDFEIYLDQTITDTDEKGRKVKVIKRDFHKLIELKGATYAKRKQDLIDEKTGEVIAKKGEADESVVIKLYGELLPRFNKGIMRGRLYSRGLLELDANKDERAILLGFKLLTRIDQMRQGAKGKDRVSDDNLYVKLDRKTLIEWADYQQTDEVNKSVANQHLIKTLNKLVEIKCLRGYEPKTLTTKDDLKITLYPHPIALKLPDNKPDTHKIEIPKTE